MQLHPQDEVNAGDALQSGKEVRPDTSVLPTSAVASETEEVTDLLADNDDEFIDEEALRDIVREMVRSELQGELGDRITRNVRKMVRREIQRALSSRELD